MDISPATARTYLVYSDGELCVRCMQIFPSEEPLCSSGRGICRAIPGTSREARFRRTGSAPSVRIFLKWADLRFDQRPAVPARLRRKLGRAAPCAAYTIDCRPMFNDEGNGQSWSLCRVSQAWTIEILLRCHPLSPLEGLGRFAAAHARAVSRFLFFF